MAGWDRPGSPMPETQSRRESMRGSADRSDKERHSVTDTRSRKSLPIHDVCDAVQVDAKSCENTPQVRERPVDSPKQTALHGTGGVVDAQLAGSSIPGQKDFILTIADGADGNPSSRDKRGLSSESSRACRSLNPNRFRTIP